MALKPLRFSEDFFARDTLEVAPDILGSQLVRVVDGHQLRGIIVECEAYKQHDTACHAYRGKTARNAVMFGPPGRAYVYFVYGIHHMLNIVTEPEGVAAAILVRALAPLAGCEIMRRHRGVQTLELLTSGPARLTQAFAIDRTFNGCNLLLGDELWIEPGSAIPPQHIARGPRVGIPYAAESDRLAPWRFWVRDSPFVSVRR